MPDYILPSGESNFFDTTQLHVNNNGSGINYIYPSPSDFNQQSGIYKTYPADLSVVYTSGIFEYNNLSGLFSTFSSVPSGDIKIFNSYIHYYPSAYTAAPTSTRIQNGRTPNIVGYPVKIPFVSNFTVTPPFNVYSVENYEYYSYQQIIKDNENNPVISGYGA
jgi:hypothetical protein